MSAELEDGSLLRRTLVLLVLLALLAAVGAPAWGRAPRASIDPSAHAPPATAREQYAGPVTD